MLTRLFLRLKGDVVGALLHERQAAMKVFISAKEAVKNVVDKIESEVGKIDAELAALAVKKVALSAEADAAKAQLVKLESIL